MRDIRRRVAATVIAASAILFAIVPVSVRAQTVEPRIINGAPAGAGSWPNIVALLSASNADSYLAQFCGGTLVTPTIVLTAAHCVDDIASPTDVQVVVGPYDLSQITPAQRVAVTKIAVHPDWNPTLKLNDVALLTMAAASSAPPMPIINPYVSSLNLGTPLTIAGWGDTDPTDVNASPHILQQATVLYRDVSTCVGVYWYFEADIMLCASGDGTTPVADTCQGDSGGPIALNVNGTRTLVGDTSFGAGCGQAEAPGVYARLSGLWPWILSNPEITAPGITSVTSTGSTVSVTWNPPATNWPVSAYAATIGSATSSVTTTSAAAVAAGGAVAVRVQSTCSICSTGGGVAAWSGTPTPTRAPVVAVSLQGAAQAGATLTATATSDDPWGSAVAYYWTANGRAIPGATGPTYAVRPVDAGKRIGVTVASANAVGTSFASATARTKARVGPSLRSSRATIRGVPEIGSTLVARPPAVTAFPAPKITYRWYRDGELVEGQTRRTYVVEGRDWGSQLRCRMRISNSLGTVAVRTAPVRIR